MSSRSSPKRNDRTLGLPLQETIFVNSSRPSVKVIGDQTFLDNVSAVLRPLNYSAAYEARSKTPHCEGSTIIVIDGAIPEALNICAQFVDDCPKILVSNNTDLTFRVECARANISTIIASPVDPNELILWLEHLGGMIGQQPASILLVDDDPLSSEVYAEMLRASGMTVKVQNDPLQIIDTLDRGFFDIIIMDLQMPNTDGIEIAKVVRQHQNYLSIPIVFLSSEENKTIQMQARRFGGDDFISKRADFDALVALVQLRVERARVMQGLIEKDGLTGLVNHKRFKERVSYEQIRFNRSKQQFCIVMIDVDHFKKVNDTWGHPIGDKVLSILARSLVGWVRQTDVVGRYGGEEFAVLMLDTTPEVVFEVINNFRIHFSKIVFDGEPTQFSMTLSAGIAGSVVGAEPEMVFAEADKALYLAKNSGRNRVEIAEIADVEAAPVSRRKRGAV